MFFAQRILPFGAVMVLNLEMSLPLPPIRNACPSYFRQMINCMDHPTAWISFALPSEQILMVQHLLTGNR